MNLLKAKKKKTKKSTIETENVDTLTKIEVVPINEVKDLNLQEQDLIKDEKLGEKYYEEYENVSEKQKHSDIIRIDKDEFSENIIEKNLRKSTSESISQEHSLIEKENIQNVETGVIKQKKEKEG